MIAHPTQVSGLTSRSNVGVDINTAYMPMNANIATCTRTHRTRQHMPSTFLMLPILSMGLNDLIIEGCCCCRKFWPMRVRDEKRHPSALLLVRPDRSLVRSLLVRLLCLCARATRLRRKDERKLIKAHRQNSHSHSLSPRLLLAMQCQSALLIACEKRRWWSEWQPSSSECMCAACA